MKYNKVVIYLVFFLLLMSFVFAEQKSLGVFKQDECVNLMQVCDNCTYVNTTSILYPNSFLFNINMSFQKQGTIYNHSFCNTSLIGTYIVNTYGDLDGEITTGSFTYMITPDGTRPSTSQGLMYSFLLIILMIFFVAAMVGAVNIDGKNEYDVGGGLAKINFNKYYKIGLFFLAYLLLIFITFTTYQISVNFLFLGIAAVIFDFIYTTLLILLAPVFIVFVIIALIKIVLDAKLQDLSNRGLKPYAGDRYG